MLAARVGIASAVTPAMDTWPWLVRHVKGNKTALEDCFGKPCPGEAMAFAEAALFRLAVSPSGTVRIYVRQRRADARFVRRIWLGKTLYFDEHLSATDEGVFTTRTTKRVPDAEQRRGDLVNNCQGTPWDRLAGRPAGRPREAPPEPQQASDRLLELKSAVVRRRKI